MRTLTAALKGFGTAKELALAAGCSHRTAQHYQAGYSFPDVLRLTRIMAKSRAVTEAVLRMAGLDDASLDLEEARLRRLLAELEVRRAELHARLAAAEALAGSTAGAAAPAERRPINGRSQGPVGSQPLLSEPLL